MIFLFFIFFKKKIKKEDVKVDNINVLLLMPFLFANIILYNFSLSIENTFKKYFHFAMIEKK